MYLRKFFLLFLKFKKIIYLDNSSTNQKPKILFKSVINNILKKNFNLNRGENKFIIKNNVFLNKFKHLIKKLIKNKFIEELVIFYNSSYIINFLIKNFLYYLKNSKILVSTTEHNSIFIPLIKIIKSINLKIIIFPLIKNRICYNIFCNYFNEKIKIVFLSQISNLGYIFNIKKIVKIIHYNKSILILDATQSIGNIDINLHHLKIDFLFFSLHKIFSFTGISILYSNIFYNNKLILNNYGSGIISLYNYNKIEFKKFEKKFEPSTQNYIGIFSSYYSIKWFITNKHIFFFINLYFKKIINLLIKKKNKFKKNIFIINNKKTIFNYFLETNKCILRCDNLCNYIQTLFYKNIKKCRFSVNFYNEVKELLKVKYLILFFNFRIMK